MHKGLLGIPTVQKYEYIEEKKLKTKKYENNIDDNETQCCDFRCDYRTI